jgi:prophage regulatory protein
MTDHILRLPDVVARTGLRRSSIYLRIKAGELKPVRLGPRAIGFLASEIDAWISHRERVQITPHNRRFTP